MLRSLVYLAILVAVVPTLARIGDSIESEDFVSFTHPVSKIQLISKRDPGNCYNPGETMVFDASGQILWTSDIFIGGDNFFISEDGRTLVVAYNSNTSIGNMENKGHEFLVTYHDGVLVEPIDRVPK